METHTFHRPGQKTFGPWGNHTSSLDFCEDNYTHHDHIAEFWNTVSNIPFILLGLWGILKTRGLPNRSRHTLTQSFLIIIGTGSFIFHGTLIWHAQVFLDELPMIWSGAMYLYTASVGGNDHGTLAQKLTIGSIPLLVSWLYLRYPNPILHQVAYAALQIVSLIKVVGLFKSLPTTTETQRRKRDECSSNFAKGVLTFLLGFAIWNVDNIFCDGLTSLRSSGGPLLGVLTQGHAWWHLLTGLGASRIVSALTYLTLMIKHPNDFEFAYFLGHPYVRRTKKAQPKML